METEEFIPTVTNELASWLDGEDIPVGEDLPGTRLHIGHDSGPMLTLIVDEGTNPEYLMALGRAIRHVIGE